MTTGSTASTLTRTEWCAALTELQRRLRRSPELLILAPQITVFEMEAFLTEQRQRIANMAPQDVTRLDDLTCQM